MFDFTKIQVTRTSSLTDAVFDEDDASVELETLHIFEVDPLILSCVAFRLNSNHDNNLRGHAARRISIDAIFLQKEMTEQDIELASKIRDDFAKKLAYFALTVGALSRFKQALNEFLVTNFKRDDGKFHISDRFAGMIHMLPYFYDYNIKQQALFDDRPPRIKHDTVTGTKRISYLASLDPARKKSKEKIEFWFEDMSDNTRIMAQFNKNDPLLPLLRKVAVNGITVSGTFKKRSNYATEYYVLHNWEIVND